MVLGLSSALGVGLATAAAVIFAVQYLFVRLATDGGSITDIMLVSLLTNVVVMVPLTLLIHGVPRLSTIAVLSFVAAGISGSLLARLCMFKSVEAIGASRTSPVVASNVFFATILAIVVFGERLTLSHFFGIVLIVVGVAAISWETAHDADPDVSIRELGLSLALPLLAALFIGFEPIFVAYGLATGSPVLPGVAIKALAATIGFVAYLALTNGFRVGMLRWGPYMKWYLGAGLTSTAGIAAYFSALEIAPVVLVVPLLQTSPLVVVVLSALFLPERLERVTWRLVASSAVVVVGAMLVSVS